MQKLTVSIDTADPDSAVSLTPQSQNPQRSQKLKFKLFMVIFKDFFTALKSQFSTFYFS